MTDAQKFHELTGGCWHKVYSYEGYIDYPSAIGGRTVRRDQVWYKCRKCENKSIDERSFTNPAYFNAADILNLMREFCREERYGKFIQELAFEMFRTKTAPSINEFIEMFILNPPALLRKAVEFLEGR